ncbi:MAG TPA: ABC transporter ATP-binding protein [Candidatus Nanoarchaeia archaeon]|nr:ABC transporter ATP-binding protein [Candidatus Nanoarchaeia archaeon]
MNVIELKEINKVFHGGEDTIALRDVNLQIKQGEFVAIMGPSGSGKSTLMNIIGLLDSPSTGEYKLEGHDVSRLSDKSQAKMRREKIGFVFQSFNLIPRMSLQQNVELPMIYDRIKPARRHQRAVAVLNKVGLGDRASYRVNQISGGQLQRAAIARALVNQPSLILADEPTGNLDSKTGQVIMQLLTDLNHSGVTVIIVTHDLNIARFAKRLVHVKDGRIESVE